MVKKKKKWHDINYDKKKKKNCEYEVGRKRKTDKIYE